MATQEIVEIKRMLDGREHRYRCALVARTADWLSIRYDLAHPTVVGTLALPAGAMTIAHYWTARPYTAYHWLDADGQTLGVYLNAASGVQISDHTVAWQDLALDVLVTAPGGIEILDDEEARAAPAWAQPAIAHARTVLITESAAIAAEVIGWTQTARAGTGRRRSPC
jgi:predicted RNA-binding protein associated with RNAse of E/G family